MASRKAGDVWIAVHPDSSLFGTRAREQVRKETAGIKVDIPVTADTKPAVASVEALKARMLALNENLARLRLAVRGEPAEAAIAKVQAKMAVLAKTVAKVTMSADTRKLDAQIVAKIADLKKLQQGMSALKMDADDKALTAKILALEKQLLHLRVAAGNMKIDADKKAAQAKIASLVADIKLLKANAKDITLVASNVSALRSVALLKAEIASLQKQARDIQLGGNIDVGKLLAAEAGLLGLEAAAEKLTPVMAAGDTALAAFGRGITGMGRGWGILLGNVRLFGGILGRVLPVALASVAVWHIAADAVIEFGAVWIPAGIAVAAFAFAASDAANEIVQRMQAVHTVMDATGKSIPQLKSGMEQLHDAVRPQVYQLFGDALTIMNKKGGAFTGIIKGTGTVLDQLAARITAAVTSGSGFNSFLGHAVTDVSKLGDSIGNVFGIFGNFFKVIPGFATGLLTIGDDFTKILEKASAAAEPIIKVGLLLHGYLLYTGVAVTATLAFVGAMANLIKAFITFGAGLVLTGAGALADLAAIIGGAIVSVVALGIEMVQTAGEAGLLAGAMVALEPAIGAIAAVNPFVWVAAAVVLLGGLIFEMNRSRDAAQQFNDSVQKTIQNASLTSLQSTLQQSAAQTAAKLAGANHDLNKALSEQGPAVTGAATRWSSNYSPAVDHAARSVHELTAGQQQIADQSALVNGRIGALSKQYGGNTAALGALVAAGITSAQITDKNKDKWAQALIQISATTQGYAAMGTQAGVVGNDLDVLGRTVTSQSKAVQVLNQAWGQFISDVIGTQGSFDTVAQGFSTLSDHSGALKLSLGKLKVSYKDTNAAIDSLTPSGIALNQAFGEQVGNVDKLFASWRTAGLAGNLFTAGVKDAIGPLVKYANGSQEATAQLVALAQEAGYQGPISMKALTTWLGNTHGATKKLKDITNQATTQEALLTGAMQNQGDFISSKLLGDINNAILAYNGVEGAVRAYGTALATSGKGSDKASTAMTKAVNALVQSGVAMGSSAQQIGAIVAKTFGISMPAAMKRVQQAMGNMVAGLPPAQKNFELFAISGLGRTRTEADKLWKKFSESNLTDLANKAGTTRGKFDTLATKTLPITRDQADKLWKMLRLQYLDALGQKSDTTRGKFIQLAEKGLDYTRQQAQHLWDTLHRQQLTDAAGKAGETKTQFEHLASQLGVTKGYADRLWTSLHKVSSGSPYNVRINEKGLGVFTIQGPPGMALHPGFAAGGYVFGGTAGKDSVAAMLMPGEVIVPTQMVRQGAVDHLRGQLPGFAKGGAVPGGGLSELAGQTTDFHNRFTQVLTNAMKSAMSSAMAAAIAAAQAAQGGGGTGTPGDIVSYARSFLGKIPYVFGGTTLQGMDCSGFTSMILSHFGYRPPRTSEAQGSWVHATPTPQAGGLAFYHSPAGGPDPGHVAVIDRGGATAISQGGGLGPKIIGLHALPLLWTGIPPGGFHKPVPSGGASGGAPGQAQAWMHAHMGDYGWGGAQWPPLLSLWNRESGWRWNAKNPGSGAYGIPQALPASKMASIAADWRTNPVTQMRWGAEYVRGRYGNPATAWRHELSAGWYGGGGMVPGMAAGGLTGNQMKFWLGAAQYGEVLKYRGLAASFSHGPAKYLTKTVRGELKTLAAREASEARAYKAVISGSMTKSELSHLGATARSEYSTAGDKALSKLPGGHPGWASDLRKYLGQISTLTGKTLLPGTGPVPGGGGTSGTPKPPVPSLPKVVHTYGGDVSDVIGTFISSVAAPFGFARGGMARSLAQGGMAKSFDRGGVLAPGMNHNIWNGTGKSESLVPAGGPVEITLSWDLSRIPPGLDPRLLKALRYEVKTKGGGSAQKLLGAH